MNDLHQQLVGLLGTESKKGWLVFMATLDQELPFLKSGRPSFNEINDSLIGRSGHSSWKSFCNSSTKEKGLGWSYETYRQWRKSWNVVQANPYLKELELTASEINTISLNCSRSNVEFPHTFEALTEYKDKLEVERKARKANSIIELKNKNTELLDRENQLNQELIKLQVKVDTVTKHNTELSTQLELANKRIGVLEDHKAQAVQANKRLKTDRDTKADKIQKLNQEVSTYKDVVTTYEEMSFFDKLKNLFR